MPVKPSMLSLLLPLFTALLLSVPAALVSLPAAAAIEPVEFATDEQQRRYRSLIAELRCPKCQNENLAESNAPIANDLRMVVAELIRDGRSDSEIRAFLQERYGDFILYSPPLRADTLLLWLGPLIMFLIGVLVVWRVIRGRPEAADTLPTVDEARVRELLAGDSPADSETGSSRQGT
jgi:cytochrome c-type biogenesis protein CcmH